MHYQIFISGEQTNASQRLIAAGLADHVADAEHFAAANGPDGERGLLFAWRKIGVPEMGYRPDAQTWLPAAAAGELPARRYWVGLWNDKPITPEDLLRPYAYGGKAVRLGDGHDWRIPQAAALPKDLILRDDGSYRFAVQRQFHEFYLRACDYFLQIGAARADADGEVMVTIDEDWIAFCLQAIRLNYRLVPEVAVTHLRLFSDQNLAKLLDATLDGLKAHYGG